MICALLTGVRTCALPISKLGIVGLSKSIALDMERFHVRSNCVSHFAWSRMIGTIPTQTEAEKERVARMQAMGPEKNAPQVGRQEESRGGYEGVEKCRSRGLLAH